MANVNCIIVNPTGTSYDNVNAGGDDIPAYSCGTAAAPGDPVVLSDAEMATFTAAHTTALIQVVPDTTPSESERETIRLASKILRLGKNPGTATA